MSTGEWLAAVSLFITFTGLLGRVLFVVGRMSHRLDSLELWRNNIRNDLHEISDIMEKMRLEIQRLATVLEERTERRTFPRSRG